MSIWNKSTQRFIRELSDSGQTPENATVIVNNYVKKFQNTTKKYLEKLKQLEISVPLEHRNDILAYSSFSDLETAVDFIDGQVNISKQQETDASNYKIFSNDIVEVYKGSEKQACVEIKGDYNASWCISRSNASNMYNNYRYHAGEPSFYFVKNLQKLQNNPKDPYSFFVIQVFHNNKYKVTNNLNNGDLYMSWTQIVAIEPQLSNLQHCFQHTHLTEEEKAIYEKFQNKLSDEEFEKLTFKDKANYIDVYINSADKQLTDNQFDSCADELKNKYINLGVNLTSHHLDIIKPNKPLLNRFGEMCKRRGSESLNDAIANNNIEMVKFVSGLGVKPSEYSLNVAIRTNNIEMVKFVLGLGAKTNECSQIFCNLVYYSLDCAIMTNNIEMVKFVLGLGAKTNEYSLNYAIETNNIEMIKFILGLGAKPNHNSLNYAIMTNNIEMVKFVSGLGVKPNNSSLNVAIYTKNIEMVKFVLGLGAKTNKDSLNTAIRTNTAIRNNNIEMVKFVLELGAKLNKNSLEYAIETNNPEIISLIKSLKCCI